MRAFTFGLAIGVALGVALAGQAANLSGGETLEGWFVEVGGAIACTDPYVFADRQTIWCG